jgi:phage shock protein PspC (stress-responsive transcriptional regulator)
MSLGDELSKLSELRQSGTLTEEEFTRAKARLLNGQEPQAAPYMTYSVNTFRRSRNDRWIAGVCGGIARATGVESWVWRLFFTVLLICGGAGLLVYFLLAIFVPSE